MDFLFPNMLEPDPGPVEVPQPGRGQMDALKEQHKHEIRVECNMEEFPYFRLGKRNSKDFNKIHFAREVRSNDGGTIKQRWVVVADSELGLPGPFDQDVYVAMEAIIDEVGIHPEGYVPFTCYRIAQILGKDHSGRTYQGIREALMRMVSTRITSEKAFYLRDERVWISETFHLYDSVRFEERQSARTRAAFEYNLLFPCRWYIASRRANYVKPLDMNLYKQLGLPAAKKLYRYLDKRRHSSPREVKVDLFHLADVLPIAPSFPSKLKQVLRPPCQQLKDVGFLHDFKIVQIYGTKTWQAIFTFPDQQPIIGHDHRIDPKVQMLMDRGITQTAAESLVHAYPERIQPQIEAFDWMSANKNRATKNNPAGYLRKAIEDNYAPPKGFMDEAERQEIVRQALEENKVKQEKEEVESQIRRQLKAQIDQVKANLTPQEFTDLRKEAEDNLGSFVKQRLDRDMRNLGYLSDSSLSVIEFELDRIIEGRYLNIPIEGMTNDGERMTNDEIPNDERNPNDEIRIAPAAAVSGNGNQESGEDHRPQTTDNETAALQHSTLGSGIGNQESGEDHRPQTTDNEAAALQHSNTPTLQHSHALTPPHSHPPTPSSKKDFSHNLFEQFLPEAGKGSGIGNQASGGPGPQ